MCSRGQAGDVYQSLHQTPAVLYTLSGEVSLILCHHHLRAYFIGKGSASLVEGGDERVREPLQFGLITNKHLTGICHGNCVKSTATMHAERTATVHLWPQHLITGPESGRGLPRYLW